MPTALLQQPFAATIWRENSITIAKGSLIALFLFLLVTVYLGQQHLRTEAQLKAEILAAHIAGSLQSHDKKTLETLIHRSMELSDATSIIVYGQQGQALIAWDDFSQFQASGPSRKLPATELNNDVTSTLQLARLTTAAPVLLDGELIGKIQISRSLQALYWHTFFLLLSGVLLCGIISVVCAYLLTKIQLRRLAPVMALDASSEQVATLGDYSLRATLHDGHELNSLSLHFNQMMERIESWESDRQSEIRERREAERRLDILANHDHLTKLPNRNYFHKLLTQCVSDALERKELAALMFIDIDNFTSINAQFGYDAGDLILATIANRLCSMLRNTDTLCRVDGDEFAAILPQIESPEMALVLAQRLMRSMNQPMTLRGQKIIISGSIGIACCPLHAKEQRLFLHHTDLALKKAKASGKNYCTLYESETPPGMAGKTTVNATTAPGAKPLAHLARS
ncbi:hypothetical protein BH11PSE12_BH11PSE12_08890 [soil metagenome]